MRLEMQVISLFAEALTRKNLLKVTKPLAYETTPIKSTPNSWMKIGLASPPNRNPNLHYTPQIITLILHSTKNYRLATSTFG